MHIIDERMEHLREKMRERQMDAYLVPTADFHESEYVGDHFTCRKFLTGFTGSAGTAVVTMDEACLWVDGRYFVQAAAQLKGTQVKMMKMGQEGVPSVSEYLETHVPRGGCLGFDGRVVNSRTGLGLEKSLKDKNARIACTEDLVGMIWEDRPELSAEPAWVLEEKYAGKAAADKIAKLRKTMEKVHATVHVLTSLDDIAWLLNIRGNDIAYNPVVLSYVMVTMDEVRLFINEKVLDGRIREYLNGLGVKVLPYNDIYKEAGALQGEKVLFEKERGNYALYQAMDGKNEIIDQMNPTSQAKAEKNPVEVENEKKAHIKDGVAVTRFIYWLKHQIGKEPVSEISAQEKLESFRKKRTEKAEEQGKMRNPDAEKEGFLLLRTRNIAAGIGCRKGVSEEVLEQGLKEVLKEYGLEMEQLCGLASIDLKKEEAGLMQLSEKYKIPFVTYNADELMKIRSVSDSSDFVKKVTGVDNVCERAVRTYVPDGKLICPKYRKEKMTVALVEEPVRIRF